jgi:hypothetical protein
MTVVIWDEHDSANVPSNRYMRYSVVSTSTTPSPCIRVAPMSIS